MPYLFPPINPLQSPDDGTLQTLLASAPQPQSVVSGGGPLGAIAQAKAGSSAGQPTVPQLPDSPFQPSANAPVPSVLGTVAAPSRASLFSTSADNDEQAAKDKLQADTPAPYDWHAHGVLGNIGHVAGRFGNIAGDVLDPAATSLIPHSDLWNARRLAEDNAQVQQKTENAQAAGRELDSVSNEQANRADREAAANKPQLIETDDGYAYLDPTTQKVTPVFGQDGKQLQPFQKDTTKTPQEQAYASLVAGGMSPAAALAAVQNPKNEIKQIEIGGKPHQVMFDDKGNQIKDLGPTGEKPPTVNVNAGGATMVVPDGNGGHKLVRINPGDTVPDGALTTSGFNSGNAADVKSDKAAQEARKEAASSFRLAQQLAAKPSPTNDYALLMQFIGQTKPEQLGKLRLNQNEVALAQGTRSSFGDLEALESKVASGQSLTTQQRTDMLNTIKAVNDSKNYEEAKPASGSGGRPDGATHQVPGPDGKTHWTNAQGTVDYGVVK